MISYINFLVLLLLSYFAPEVYTQEDAAGRRPSSNAKIELRPTETTRVPVLSYQLTGPVPWQNIPNALRIRNFEAGVLCARGTWILYQDPDSQESVELGLASVLVFSSATFTCTPTAELNKIGSAQLLTKYSDPTAPVITFFSGVNLTGVAMVVSSTVKSADQLPTESTTVRSVSVMGKQHWTVVLTNGIRMCLTPGSPNMPICFITNLYDDKNVMLSTGVSVVRKGCRKSNPGLMINMTECYETGQGKIGPVNPTWPLGPPTATGPGGGNGTGGPDCNVGNGTDILDADQKMLIEARISGTLGTGDRMQAIKNTKNIWQTELFDKSFQVLSAICSNLVIDLEYLLLFAALYFYHLDKIWESGKFTDPQVTDREWREINFDMDKCLVGLETKPIFNDVQSQTIQMLQSYESLQEIMEKVDKGFGLRPNFDHVMEINWLMANLVASACTKINGYDVNFLHRFLNLYHVLYFTPVQEQWKNPGNISTTYKYVFGGYGMKKSFAKISLCALNVVSAAAVLDVYKRPMEQTNTILLPQGAQVDTDTNPSPTSAPPPPAA